MRRWQVVGVAARAVAAGIFGAGAPGAAAQAPEPDFLVQVFDAGLGKGAYRAGDVSSTPLGVRAQLVRGGAVIAEGSAAFGFPDRVTILRDPLPGDELRLFSPADAAAPARVVRYDGRPALGACPVGAQTVPGRVPPATDPGRDEAALDAIEPATVTATAPEAVSIELPRPLASGDELRLSSRRVLGGGQLDVTTLRPAEGCDGPVVPPPPRRADGRLRLGPGPLVADQRDPRFLTVGLPLTCDERSQVPCRGPVRLVDLATGRPLQLRLFFGVEVPAGATALVRLALLTLPDGADRPRGVRIAVTLTTGDSIGQPVTRTYHRRLVLAPR